MDLLYKRLPSHLVRGVLVLQAEKLTETCTEAFILKLIRQTNKECFIKGFSEYPEAFSKGFAKVERVMKILFVRRLFLWPRFRDLVEKDLEAHRPDVVELHQPLTPSMEVIQSCILEIMEACLQELRKTNLVHALRESSHDN